MLFHVKMSVHLPVDMNPERAASLKADEKALAQRLQQEGKWRHLWRIAGLYANYSVFDVDSVQARRATASSQAWLTSTRTLARSPRAFLIAITWARSALTSPAPIFNLKTR